MYTIPETWIYLINMQMLIERQNFKTIDLPPAIKDSSSEGQRCGERRRVGTQGEEAIISLLNQVVTVADASLVVDMDKMAKALTGACG